MSPVVGAPTRRAAMAGLSAAGLAGRASAGPRRLPQPDPALWDPQVGPVRESRAPGPNGPVYVRVCGGGARTPVIVLHGGPAGGHRYLRAYAALARGGRAVAFYDQSGCGRSAAPADLRLYTPARYVAELEAVRAHLGWPRAVLIGHSWGGLLAPAYADAHPQRVAALVLAGSAARWRDFQEAEDRWLRELGPEAMATVRRAQGTGRTGDPAYGALLERYYALHLCRLDPWPAWFVADGEAIDRNPVYRHLNGPSEFQMTGALSTLDGRAALGRLRTPTLVTCGEFDEGPPWVARRIVDATAGARLQVFDGLSHMSHIEDPARVVAATGAFLDGVA